MKYFLIIIVIVVIIGAGWYVAPNYFNWETSGDERSFESVLAAKEYDLFPVYFSDSVHLTLENSGFGGDDFTPNKASNFLQNKMELTEEWRRGLPAGARPDIELLSNFLFNFSSQVEFLLRNKAEIQKKYNSTYSSRHGCQNIIFGTQNGYGKMENTNSVLILCRDTSNKVYLIIETGMETLKQRIEGKQI